MPQSRSGSGAADGSRMGVMPRSSHVQPARVGSEWRSERCLFPLLDAILVLVTEMNCEQG